ncbi:MAG TPA: 4-vinyl reductase [Chloroflexia bacterium]|nr:4-vinyl reductase [Chloroflexia bacterium]
MVEQLSGNVVCLFLRGVQEISGNQYPVLLKRAGWERFVQAPPPDDWQPAATGDEMGRLIGGVYTMLGEPLTRLFLRNCGNAFAAAYLQTPHGQQMRTQLAGLPEADRLGWVVQTTAEQSTRAGAPRRVSEDAGAWYVEAAHCHICLHIRGAQAPICAFTEQSYKVVFDALLGRRVRVVEVECMAVGAPQCKHAVYK